MLLDFVLVRIQLRDSYLILVSANSNWVLRSSLRFVINLDCGCVIVEGLNYMFESVSTYVRDVSLSYYAQG